MAGLAHLEPCWYFHHYVVQLRCILYFHHSVAQLWCIFWILLMFLPLCSTTFVHFLTVALLIFSPLCSTTFMHFLTVAVELKKATAHPTHVDFWRLRKPNHWVQTVPFALYAVIHVKVISVVLKKFIKMNIYILHYRLHLNFPSTSVQMSQHLQN